MKHKTKTQKLTWKMTDHWGENNELIQLDLEEKENWWGFGGGGDTLKMEF